MEEFYLKKVTNMIERTEEMTPPPVLSFLYHVRDFCEIKFFHFNPNSCPSHLISHRLSFLRPFNSSLQNLFLEWSELSAEIALKIAFKA